MLPEIITSYDVFKLQNPELNDTALFWIIEYSPQELGFENVVDNLYLSSPNRFSIVRNECLKNPQTFANRLNEGKYRIWTIIPYEKEW